MIKILDIHSLLNGKKRVLDGCEPVEQYYDIWKNIRKEYGENVEFEAFAAGYMVGCNISVREKFTKIRRGEIVIKARENYQLEHSK